MEVCIQPHILIHFKYTTGSRIKFLNFDELICPNSILKMFRKCLKYFINISVFVEMDISCNKKWSAFCKKHYFSKLKNGLKYFSNKFFTNLKVLTCGRILFSSSERIKEFQKKMPLLTGQFCKNFQKSEKANLNIVINIIGYFR